jgi:hypothetical protein
MMKGKFLMKAFLLVALVFGVSLNSNLLNSKASSESSKEDQTAKEIAVYKQWTRVNPKPVALDASIARMCAPTFPPEKNDTNPQKNKFLTVYVNAIGQKAMMTEQSPQFPPGSVIVKEKLTMKNSTTPELLTAMVKRQKGFNPASNDWEFFALSGDAQIIQARGKLENCIACHTAKRQGDFVFRYYLPYETSMKLK